MTKLNVWLAMQNIKKGDFAKVMNVCPSQVSKWIFNGYCVVDDSVKNPKEIKLVRVCRVATIDY